VFDSTVDFVYLNGYGPYDDTTPTPAKPFNFWGWQAIPPVPAMTNNPPGSLVYSTAVLVPAGSPLWGLYKYGINGFDNEAPSQQNHIRYIRQLGNYSMPLDTFGNQYVEPSFGNLSVAPAANQHALVSWLGRPGVHLQTASTLQGGWVDHPETDGLNSTNWPAGAGAVYFRLYGPKY
jgi:hypothetical protein